MITQPTLLLDEVKCKANIARMQQKAQEHNLFLRPHFKTHQSLEIGRWFKEVGVSKITVSSLAMAEYFADEWTNITVAFPVNVLEIDTIKRLSKRIQLNLLIESTETTSILLEKLEDPVNFYIKINIGNNRTGINPEDIASIDSIIKTVKKSKQLRFIGFLGHAGQTYKCRSKTEVLEVHQEAKQKLVNLKDRYRNKYPDIIASYGDTPSCSVADDFTGLDEIRPGNFVFYDLMQQQIGVCDYKDIAVAMACPIVSIHKDRCEIVVYGGGIHFSKDRMETKDHGTIYGQVVAVKKHGWNGITKDMVVRGLSQEHGVIKVPENEIDKYVIGDLLYVFPVHSCMTVDLMKVYKTLSNNYISMLNS